MAVEIASRDKNRIPVMLAISSTNSEIRQLKVDESSGRLLVDVGSISVSASSASAGLTGAAVPTSADYMGASKAGTLTGLLLGSQTAANSLGVVLASDQAALPVTGTFWQATQPVSIASVPSHAVTNAGTFAVQATEVDGGNVTLGSKADAKSTATDTTSITIMSVLKQISASVQAPPSQAVTNAGTFAVQEADGANTTLGAKADAKNTATDTTSISIMSVLKQISASVQAPPSQAVTNAGTFAVQADIAKVGGTTTVNGGVAGTLGVGGDTANAATDAGNPIKIGGIGHTANPTAVTDGQRVAATFDKLGKQVVVGAIRDLKGMQQTQISASTSETTIVTAVASTFLDLYGLILANTGATTTKVSIRDDTAGTVRAIIEVPTLETRGFMLPVDSALPQTAVNKNWTATCASSTTALEVTALFVKNT